MFPQLASDACRTAMPAPSLLASVARLAQCLTRPTCEGNYAYWCTTHGLWRARVRTRVCLFSVQVCCCTCFTAPIVSTSPSGPYEPYGGLSDPVSYGALLYMYHSRAQAHRGPYKCLTDGIQYSATGRGRRREAQSRVQTAVKVQPSQW